MKNFIQRFSLIALSVFLILTLFAVSVSAEEANTQVPVSEESSAEVEYVLQCPACAAVTAGDPYCSSCGAQLPLKASEWRCEHKNEDGTVCGHTNQGAYCSQCGQPRPEPTQSGVTFDFNPSAFVHNLKYMAAGMIGIFLVIGVIVLTIVLLSKLTASKKADGDQD